MRSAGATAAFGALLLLFAELFHAEALLTPGVALLALAVVAPAWVWLAGRGASVTREVTARRIEEDEPLRMWLIARGGSLPVPGGRVCDRLLPEGLALGPGRGEQRRGLDVRFSRRGRRRLAPPTLRLRDPLGLCTRTIWGEREDEILVLPRIHPITVAAEGADAAGSGGGALARLGVAEVEFDGLRPLRPGTSASRIHWAAYARGAGLLERRLRPEADEQPLVILDATAPASEDALDRAVRAAGSLCLGLARGSGCAVLLPGDRRPTTLRGDLGGWPALHARLATVSAGAGPSLGAAGPTGGRTGPLLYVSARALSAPPAALLRLGGHRVLVTPGPLDGRPAAFEVAGCRGYELRRVRAAVPV